MEDPSLPRVRDDPALQSILLRSELVDALALEPEVACEKDADDESRKIYSLIQKDEFLKEQGFLEESCHSLGRLTYIRRVLLPLRSSVEGVVAAHDAHVESLRIARECATALIIESDQYVANWIAEDKVIKAEKKALEKAETKARKAEAKAKAKEEKKERERLEKEAAAKRKAEEGATHNEQEDEEPAERQDPKRRKKTRNPAATQLQDADPAVLKINDACWNPKVTEEISDFTHNVLKWPHMAHLLRLKKGPFKKIMTAGPNVDKDVRNSWAKSLTATMADFKEEAERLHKPRVSKSIEAPGDLLGLDWKLLATMEDAASKSSRFCGSEVSLLQRDELLTACLWFDWENTHKSSCFFGEFVDLVQWQVVWIQTLPRYFNSTPELVAGDMPEEQLKIHRLKVSGMTLQGCLQGEYTTAFMPGQVLLLNQSSVQLIVDVRHMFSYKHDLGSKLTLSFKQVECHASTTRSKVAKSLL